jgi:hypothetical protein
VVLSTSPYKKQTHWKQTVFYLEKPVAVNPGDSFAGSVQVSKAKENPRELNVRLEHSFNGGSATSQYYRIS